MKRYAERLLKKIVVVLLTLMLMLPFLYPFKVKAAKALNNSEWFKTSYLASLFDLNTYIDLSTYTNDLYIYSDSKYTDANGNELQNSNNYYRLNDETSSGVKINIYIGDVGKGYAVENDINVVLNGIELSDKNIYIYPVKIDSALDLYVNLTVTNESTISNLHLEAKSNVKLTLNSNLTITNLFMFDESKLSIDLNGYTLTINNCSNGEGILEISNTGSLTINENLSVEKLSVAKSTLTAKNISVTSDISFTDGAVVSALVGENKGSIVANGNIVVNNATVQNANLFGYNNNANGLKEVILDNATFNAVAIVGVSNTSNAVVSFKSNGNSMISSSSDTKYICDYSMTYKYNGNIINDESYPMFYRVEFASKIGEEPVVLGSITKSDETNYLYNSGIVDLPTYTLSGFGQNGWFIKKEDGSGQISTPVTILSGIYGDLILSPNMISGSIAVSIKLGYTPTKYTNDNYTEISAETNFEKNMDETITLTKPERFGYVFKGWKVSTYSGGTEKIIEFDTEQFEYKIEYEDLNKLAENTYELKFDAQWEADNFMLQMFFTPEVPMENVEISFDYGETWITYAEFITYDEISLNKETISFKKSITYGMTFQEYFKSISGEKNWNFPILRDNRNNSADQKRFIRWKFFATDITSESVFSLPDGENDCCLKKDENITLKAFNEQLQKNGSSLSTSWGTMEYRIYAENVDGWSIIIDGVEQTVTSSGIVVPVGKEVLLRKLANSALTISSWKVIGVVTDEIKYAITLNEQKYTAGNQYMYYSFTMPVADVYAENCAKYYYVDLSISDIIFDNAVNFNELDRTGFWYDADLSSEAMTPLFAELNNGEYTQNWQGSTEIARYFYEHNLKSNFYVTTNGKQTRNQLFLIQEMIVYLKNCYMLVRESYQDDFTINSDNDSFFRGKILSYQIQSASSEHENHFINLFNNVDDFKKYGNIVIDVSKKISVVPTKIHIEGTNVIGTIFTDYSAEYIKNVSVANVEIIGNNNIDANSSNLFLGCVFGFLCIRTLYININQYNDFDKNIINFDIYKDNFGLIGFTYGSNSGWYFSFGTKANLPDKDLNISGSEIIFHSQSDVVINNVTADYGATVYSKVHIKGNSYLYQRNYTIYPNACLTIDGYSLTSAPTAFTIYDSAVVISKGFAFDISNASNLSGGTIIANSLIMGSYSTKSVDELTRTAVIITNQILNRTSLRLQLNLTTQKLEFSNDLIIYENKNNEDDELFKNYYSATGYNVNSDTHYKFNKVKFFLFGYYKTTGNNEYDLSMKATDPDNPLSGIISKVTDDTGNYNNNISELNDDYLKNCILETSIKYNENGFRSECFVLGSSQLNQKGTSNYNYVGFENNCKVYSAGNLTFFTDVVFTDTTVVCYGKLTSKNNLIFNSGNFTAKEIGNIYNFTEILPDKTLTYKTTTLNGGTFTVDRLGVPSSTPYANAPRSTVVINENVEFTSDTLIVTDLYVNYIYDSEIFVISPDSINSVRFKGTLNNLHNNIEDITLSLVESNIDINDISENLTLINPKIKNSENNGVWKLESLIGNTVSYIGTGGQFLYSENQDIVDYVHSYQRIALYAVKETYKAKVVEGNNFIKDNGGFIVAGQEKALDVNNEILIDGENNINIILNDANMLDKVVIWYYDANNQVHNVGHHVNANNNSIEFKMPYSDIEIYIANSIDLYLDLYEIAFTADGFRTEYEESENSDKSFTYKGDIYIKQSSISELYVIENYPGDHLAKDVREKNSSSYYASIYATTNRIHIEENAGKVFDNNGKERKIILNNIIVAGSDNTVNIDEGNTDVAIYISGIVSITNIYSEAECNLQLIGLNDNKVDIFTGCGVNSNIVNMKQNGSITYNNLKLLFSGYGILGCFGKRTNSEIVYNNVDFTCDYWYFFNSLGLNVETVTINNSNISLKGNVSAVVGFVKDCDNFIINESNVSYLNAGSGGDTCTPFTGIKNEFIVDKESNVKINYRYNLETTSYANLAFVYNTPNQFKILNGSTFEINDRVLLKKLIVDGGIFTVTNRPNHPSYLLSPVIEVKGKGIINADYLYLSGFFMPNSIAAEGFGETYFIEQAKNKNLFVDGNSYDGLTLKDDGVINVTEFIGGDINAKINIEGGTVNTNKIGTIGNLVGFTQLLPKADEDSVYTYVPEEFVSESNSTLINIKGGTINISENGYIGGLYTKIEMNSGIINLSSNSVLGVNENLQRIVEIYQSKLGKTPVALCSLTMTGGIIRAIDSSNNDTNADILLPYSIAEISGADSGIYVNNFIAQNGSINFKTKNGYDESTNKDYFFDNPYYATLRDPSHSKVRYLINNVLSSQTLNISEGAVVYASEAYTIVDKGQTGQLYVADDSLDVSTENKDRSTLYTYKTFGTLGEGENKLIGYTSNSDGHEKNIYGVKTVYIKYVVDDIYDVLLSEHLGNIINNNVLHYIVGQKNSSNEYYLDLLDAECFGYVFEGWYIDDKFSGDPITQILTTNQLDITLYAKWSKQKIKFSLSIDNTLITNNFVEELQGKAGTFSDDGATFTFDYVCEGEYYSKIFNIIETIKSQFNTNSYQLMDISIKDPYYDNGIEVNIGREHILDDKILAAYLNKINDKNNTDLTFDFRISGVANIQRKVVFALNLNDKNRPIDAEILYNKNQSGVYKGENSIYFYVRLGAKLSTVIGELFGDSNLFTATATGYTFGGWYLDKNCQGTKITKDYEVLAGDTDLVLYAKWTPNQYTVEFDAGTDGVVTVENTAPSTNSGNQTLDGTIVYDEKIDGNLKFNSVTNSNLPYAWQDGHMFSYWKYTIGDKEYILNNQMFNLSDISSLNLEDQITIKFIAVYEKVSVTYNPNGGVWTDSSLASKGTKETITISDDYNKPLLGYTLVNSEFKIVSTTSNEFENLKTYVANDYRYKIQRKGYTFLGWFDENGNEYKSFPRYEKITVEARWEENTYKINLNPYDSNKEYTNIEFSNSDILTATVTVGDEIDGGLVINWPNRFPLNSTWYAYDNRYALTENNKRYLLGFTFDSLDPGSTQYAASITKLLNENCIFNRNEDSLDGSIFRLPEDNEYGKNIVKETNVVLDYPNGFSFNMYAVYRQLSVEFIERIVIEDEEQGTIVKETLMYSCPWNTYVDYPSSYVATSNVDTNSYQLVGWYVNGYDINKFDKYPTTEDDYNNKIATYKSWAQNKGIYDIKVYTVYAAGSNVTGKKLTANSDPSNTNPSYFNYIVPSSVVSGQLKYQIYNKLTEFNIVPLSELDYYDTKLANNTFAIRVKFYDTNGNLRQSVDLDSSINGEVSIDGLTLEAGWNIQFELYHSKVISDAPTHVFDIKFSFNNIDNQYINFEKLSVQLTESVYTVYYGVKIPNVNFDLKLLNSNGFSLDGDYYVKKINVKYGSSLLTVVPEYEGFVPDRNWRLNADDSFEIDYSDLNFFEYLDSKEFSNSFTFNLEFLKHNSSYGNEVYLAAEYLFIHYSLQATEKVNEKWNIYDDNNLYDPTNINNTISYHNTVKFIIKDGISTHYEFVFIKYTDKEGNDVIENLTDYAVYNKNDGSYEFYMPSHEIYAMYLDVLTLFLEEGNISITENNYTHKGQTINWPGSYIILMDENNNIDNSSTENVLSLSGDLEGREIYLGNLYIVSDNSIILDDGATVKLMLQYEGERSSLNVKNILVPGSSNLTLDCDSSSNAQINLNPSQNIAGIGDYSNSGEIHINNIDIKAYVSAPSNASVIGSNMVDGKSEYIGIFSSNITVYEYPTVNAAYEGAWLGGKHASLITISESTVNLGEKDNMMSGPYVLYASKIVLDDAQLGTDGLPLYNPIYAKETISIYYSQIYMNVHSVLPDDLKAPFGTSNSGTIEVFSSTIFIETSISDKMEYYTGTLELHSSLSKVIIYNTMFIEIDHGDIIITNSDVKQGTGTGVVTHAYNGDYYLINEFTTTTTPSLTVHSLAIGTKIITDDITLESVEINGNANILLNGNLEIEKLGIYNNSILNVETNDNDNSIIFTSNSPITTTTKGTYKQSGGKLLSDTVEFGNNQLDIEIDNVNTTLKSLYGYNVTINDSTINASGKVGSYGDNLEKVTYVNIKGTVEINATTIGALGEHNEVFTIVNIEDDATLTYTGTLVKDVYRIAYELEDGNYSLAELPVVFRTTCKNGQEEQYLPSIPSNPLLVTTGIADYFSNWYFIGENEKNVALSSTDVPGFSNRSSSLEIEYIEFAIDNNDGTKTLVLYAWLKVRGEGTITDGRLFNKFISTDTSVEIMANYAWSALFNIEVAYVANSKYQLIFDKDVPVNTKFTLIDFSNSTIKYYYFVVTSATKTISLDEFIQMGKKDVNPSLFVNSSESLLKHQLLISADFSQVEPTPNSDEIFMSLQLNLGNNDIFNVQTLSYELLSVYDASIELETPQLEDYYSMSGQAKITLPIDEVYDGKEIALVLEILNEDKLKLTNSLFELSSMINVDEGVFKGEFYGSLINENKILFNLGKYSKDSLSQNSNNVYEFYIEYLIHNFIPNAYTLRWNIAIADDNLNVMNNIIASDYTSKVMVINKELNIFDIDLVKVNGEETNNKVYEFANQYEFIFETTIDPTNLELRLEVIKENGTSALNGANLTTELVESTNGVYTVKVVLGEDFVSTITETNPYQIVFSSDGFTNNSSSSDDELFKFVIVK